MQPALTPAGVTLLRHGGRAGSGARMSPDCPALRCACTGLLKGLRLLHTGSDKVRLTGEKNLRKTKTVFRETKTISRKMEIISRETETISPKTKIIFGEMKTISPKMKTISRKTEIVSPKTENVSRDIKTVSRKTADISPKMAPVFAFFRASFLRLFKYSILIIF
jgi:hypothetical protein